MQNFKKIILNGSKHDRNALYERQVNHFLSGYSVSYLQVSPLSVDLSLESRDLQSYQATCLRRFKTFFPRGTLTYDNFQRALELTLNGGASKTGTHFLVALDSNLVLTGKSLNDFETIHILRVLKCHILIMISYIDKSEVEDILQKFIDDSLLAIPTDMNTDAQEAITHLRDILNGLKGNYKKFFIAAINAIKQALIQPAGGIDIPIGDLALAVPPLFVEELRTKSVVDDIGSYVKYQVSEVVGGVGDSLWGTWTMVRHPIDTAGNIANAVAHPITTTKAVANSAWEHPARFIGSLAAGWATGKAVSFGADKVAGYVSKSGDAAQAALQAEQKAQAALEQASQAASESVKRLTDATRASSDAYMQANMGAATSKAREFAQSAGNVAEAESAMLLRAHSELLAKEAATGAKYARKATALKAAQKTAKTAKDTVAAAKGMAFKSSVAASAAGRLNSLKEAQKQARKSFYNLVISRALNEYIRIEAQQVAQEYNETNASSGKADASSDSESDSSTPSSSFEGLASGATLFSNISAWAGQTNESSGFIPGSDGRDRSIGIGPKTLPGWQIQDVAGDGNCFYYALLIQLRHINHEQLRQIHPETEPHDALRLHVQGAARFQDREWTEDTEFPEVVRKLDVILAVVNTANPAAGFTCYYIDDSGEYITDAHGEFTLPDKPIVEMAYNGNHYMSVHYHPALENGSLRVATEVDSHAGAGVFSVPPTKSSDSVVGADDEKDDHTLGG